MMNVQALNSARLLVRSFSSSSALAARGFGDREQALENQFVLKHEREALQKLREQLDAKASHEQLHKAVADVEAAVKSRKGDASDDDSHTEHLLEVRKEFLDRLRKLEDEVAEIKIRLRRLQ